MPSSSNRQSNNLSRCPKKLDHDNLTEWLLRAFALMLMAFVVARWGHAWWMDNSRWSALLLLIAESYTLMLIVSARRAIQRDLSAAAMIATIYGTCSVVLLGPQGTVHLAPEWVGVALQVGGMVWQFSAKVVIGRSFGLLPARRGLVTTGPYRVVRHPIYLGYLISHVGFLLVNFSWRNVAVLVLLYVAQLYRIHCEEAVLANGPEYGDYRQKVRSRLLPFVY